MCNEKSFIWYVGIYTCECDKHLNSYILKCEDEKIKIDPK